MNIIKLFQNQLARLELVFLRFKADEAFEESFGKIVLFYSLLFLLLVSSILTVVFFLNGNLMLAALNFAYIVVVLGLLFLFKKTNSLKWPVRLIFAFVWTTTLYRTLNTGGYDAPTFYYIPILATMSILLLNWKEAALWNLVYQLVPLSFLILKKQGFVFPNSLTPATADSLRLIFMAVAGVFLYIDNIYYRYSTQKFLEKLQNEKEENLNLARVLAHDLSNPLMILRLSLQTISAKHPHLKSEIEKTLHATQSLDQIVSSVRDLMAITSGKKTLNKVAVDLKKVWNEILFIHQDNIAAKKLKIEGEIHGVVLGDEIGLTHQVISNFLSNAIKFSFINSRISVSSHQIGNEIELSIRDAGIGIPADLLKVIFDTSSDSSRKGTTGENGSGFGIIIAKSYIEKMDGELKIKSWDMRDHEDNHGTEIQIKLKAAA